MTYDLQDCVHQVNSRWHTRMHIKCGYVVTREKFLKGCPEMSGADIVEGCKIYGIRPIDDLQSSHSQALKAAVVVDLI
jgi:hypothetical protein